MNENGPKNPDPSVSSGDIRGAQELYGWSLREDVRMREIKLLELIATWRERYREGDPQAELPEDEEARDAEERTFLDQIRALMDELRLDKMGLRNLLHRGKQDENK